MFAHMSTRHLQQASQRTLNHEQNENDESKATITQQPVVERRKTKRETLANYLKTSENIKKASSRHQARNSGNSSRNGCAEFQRQSSKTSLTSQQSGKKRRTGSTLGSTVKTLTNATMKSSSSVGKQIRRLGKTPTSTRGTVAAQMSNSIEMVRSGRAKITTTRNSNLKSSLDPGVVVLKKSSSPITRHENPTCLLEAQGQKSQKERSDEDNEDSDTPRQMHLDVF